MTLLISLFTYNIRCLDNILSPSFPTFKKNIYPNEFTLNNITSDVCQVL